MKLKEILLEGLSPTLYHSTRDLGDALNIMDKDKFILSGSLGSGVKYSDEEIKKYPYYFSMARTVQSTYIKRALKSGGAVFELDGTKLGFNHKGGPIDYFGYQSHSSRLKIAKQPKTKYELPKKLPDPDSFFFFFEAEDRIRSKKKIIPDAHKYIKAVHFIIIKREPENIYAIDSKRRIEVACENIKPPYPVYIYESIEPFKYLDKRKAKKL